MMRNLWTFYRKTGEKHTLLWIPILLSLRYPPFVSPFPIGICGSLNELFQFESRERPLVWLLLPIPVSFIFWPRLFSTLDENGRWQFLPYSGENCAIPSVWENPIPLMRYLDFSFLGYGITHI